MPRVRPLTHILPAAALASLGFALWSVTNSNVARTMVDPPRPPAQAVYSEQVAARGLVEPSSEIVAVASELAGVVASVMVRAGDEVVAGAPLFALDDRSYRAALKEAQARVATATAEFLEVERRMALQRARIEERAAENAAAAAEHDRAVADRARYQRLSRRDFVSEQRYEAAAADARKAAAGLERARAGLVAEREQLLVLAATRQRVQAEREAAAAAQVLAEVDLDKTIVRARLDATVLSVDLRPGERVGDVDGTHRVPPLRLGRVRPLHVRVEVDEADAWRVVPGAAARAQLRGNPALAADLTFVRFEPFVRPKTNLAGSGPERVDTRVLQVIYAVADADAFPARVGQQVDVFIAADTAADIPIATAATASRP